MSIDCPFKGVLCNAAIAASASSLTGISIKAYPLDTLEYLAFTILTDLRNPNGLKISRRSASVTSGERFPMERIIASFSFNGVVCHETRMFRLISQERAATPPFLREGKGNSSIYAIPAHIPKEFRAASGT